MGFPNHVCLFLAPGAHCSRALQGPSDARYRASASTSYWQQYPPFAQALPLRKRRYLAKPSFSVHLVVPEQGAGRGSVSYRLPTTRAGAAEAMQAWLRGSACWQGETDSSWYLPADVGACGLMAVRGTDFRCLDGLVVNS